METQPFQPEKIYTQATQEVKMIGFSPSISPEMVRLLDLKENETQEDYLKRISEILKNFPEHFPQIAPEVKEFLRETAQEKPGYYDEEELRVLLLTLLSTPKPDEQKEKLKENQELLLKEKAKEIKREIGTNALIEISLKEVKPLTRLSFFAENTKEEREGYREQIENALEQATKSERLKFFGAITPEERKKYQEEIKDTLKKAKPWDRLYFFGAITSEERKQYHKEIENSLKEVGPGARLHFFGAITKDERSISPLAQKLNQRVITELTSEIGDLGLRKQYFTLLCDYLGIETSSLIALSYIPKKKLALALGIILLGTNPLPALSWRLKPQEYLDLLYSLSRLAGKEENRELFKGLILPFRPREREVAGFEEYLIGWIQSLDFLNSLGNFLGSRKILEGHLSWVKERQKQEKIETTSPKVSFSFLRDIAKELKIIKTKVKDNFQQLLELEELDSEKFEEFINNWLGEIESIQVLAQRLHQPYPEVKKLLTRIVLAELEGRWTKSRYNLENPLTRKQLRPLIKGKSQEEINDLILSYHQGIKFILEEKKGEEAISEKAIFSPPEDLKERLKENLLTHQHFREIFKLKEFQNLTEEEKGLIERYVLSVFFEKGKIPFKTPKELSEYFQNKIPQETLKVLVILHQFFKDFAFGQKSSEDLLNILEKGLKTIKEKIPETENLAFINQDLGEWLKAEIEAKAEQKGIKSKRILLVHTTDHPKTLLEIGKYPFNSGSCQSYNYSYLELAKSLLGSVFDSHIQAVVIREIETQKIFQKLSQ